MFASLREAYSKGHRTPAYLGRARNDFGAQELPSRVAELAPLPRPQPGP